MIIKKSVPW